MPPNELRRAWAEIIDPADYDSHMAAIGQAEANAKLIRALIEDQPMDPGSKLLFAGAGTGQMFDYVAHDFLSPYEVTFTDIREAFLDQLRSRLGATGFRIVVDDVEDPQVGSIDGAVLVLVLEHVGWQKALDALIDLGSHRFYLIVQINPPGMTTAVAPNRVLPPSLACVSADAKPSLIDLAALARFMEERAFSVSFRRDVEVADGKTMCGLVFSGDITSPKP
jgi:hypothetical protein